ncbi:hypothetical protein DFJ74DRAFT_159154 [Hyaloraphidium curvatum]|nr:hypothetical protein DFJ74DRAFT_159154 [Hyaloraphidium curvatum]
MSVACSLAWGWAVRHLLSGIKTFANFHSRPKRAGFRGRSPQAGVRGLPPLKAWEKEDLGPVWPWRMWDPRSPPGQRRLGRAMSQYRVSRNYKCNQELSLLLRFGLGRITAIPCSWLGGSQRCCRICNSNERRQAILVCCGADGCSRDVF